MTLGLITRLSSVALTAMLAALVVNAPAGATIVRYHFSQDGADYGTVDVRMFDSAMPITVNNFLNYLNDDDWDGSFIHRSDPEFVVQGGGFSIPTTGMIGDPTG